MKTSQKPISKNSNRSKHNERNTPNQRNRLDRNNRVLSARHFALYALLMKIGIKSEIHDCSIAIARLMTEKGILNEDLVNDISSSKQIRIDIQYYIERELDKASTKRNAENAPEFVLRIEKAIRKHNTRPN